jgi:DNA invertase Pin-like site-specific DNA recombinase
MGHRVGAYVRISEDLDGLGLGVARQEEDCRALAERRGWTVTDVFRDNDVSAYKARAVRPEFERMLSVMEAGLLDGVVVYDLDRFARKPSDLERAIVIFDSRPGLLFATVQSDIDLSASDGRTMARVMVAFANKSSMDTSRRVARKHLELARAGVPVGGSRPFGWQADRRSIDRSEARLLRQAAADILAGVGLHTICRVWNDAGIATTRGNPWRKTVLKNAMLSPRLRPNEILQIELLRGVSNGGRPDPIQRHVGRLQRPWLVRRLRGSMPRHGNGLLHRRQRQFDQAGLWNALVKLGHRVNQRWRGWQYLVTSGPSSSRNGSRSQATSHAWTETEQ